MAKENNGQAGRDYKSRKKRVKRIRIMVILALLVVLAVGGAVYLYSLFNKSYKGCEVISSLENVANSTTQFISYQSAVIRYSRDGAEAVDKDGKQMWNGSYEMDRPIADTCGKYAVIADQGGKSVEIFDDKGGAGRITTVYDIIKVRIASQGVVAVLMESSNTNYITIYDKDGTVLVDQATDMLKDGYPIDIALSADGQKLITDYLSIKGGKEVGIITFYNFGEVGQNWTDGIMGAYTFEGTVIPRVAFNDNDTVCAYKDSGLMIFEYKEQPKVILDQNFEEKISSVLYNKENAGVVLDEGDGGSRKLVLYNLLGKKSLEKRIDFNYSHIEMTEEEIIMNDNISCIIMKPDGRVKFKYTFDTGISSLIPINHLDRYILVSDKKISQIALTE
jgi:hypothetical protein